MRDFETELDEWMTPRMEEYEEAAGEAWEENLDDYIEDLRGEARERFDNDLDVIRARENYESELREKFASEIWPAVMEALHE